MIVFFQKEIKNFRKIHYGMKLRQTYLKLKEKKHSNTQRLKDVKQKKLYRLQVLMNFKGILKE